MKKCYKVVGFIKIGNKYKRLYFSCYSADDAIATVNLKWSLYNNLFDKGKIEDFELGM